MPVDDSFKLAKRRGETAKFEVLNAGRAYVGAATGSRRAGRF
jgi:hypothetical protein